MEDDENQAPTFTLVNRLHQVPLADMNMASVSAVVHHLLKQDEDDDLNIKVAAFGSSI